jgi:hypothetical protein
MKPKENPEPEVESMFMGRHTLPAYDVQTAGDAGCTDRDAQRRASCFQHPRLLMRGLSGARVETSLATMAYNIKRMTKVLVGAKLTEGLQPI